eukprot:scaffold181596_cov16-Tisochrysis_lutea.AAC.2
MQENKTCPSCPFPKGLCLTSELGSENGQEQNAIHPPGMLPAADVVGAFKTYVAAAASKGEGVPSGVDMQVQVLTSGFWPSYPIMEAKLPEVSAAVSRGMCVCARVYASVCGVLTSYPIMEAKLPEMCAGRGLDHALIIS